MTLDFNRTPGSGTQHYALSYNTAVAAEHGDFVDWEPTGAYTIDKVGTRNWELTYQPYCKDQTTGKTRDYAKAAWVGEYQTLKDAKAAAADYENSLRTAAGERTYVLKDSTVDVYGTEYSDCTWLEFNTYTGQARLVSVCTAPGVRGHSDTVYLSGELAELHAAIGQALAEPGVARRSAQKAENSVA